MALLESQLSHLEANVSLNSLRLKAPSTWLKVIYADVCLVNVQCAVSNGLLDYRMISIIIHPSTPSTHTLNSNWTCELGVCIGHVSWVYGYMGVGCSNSHVVERWQCIGVPSVFAGAKLRIPFYSVAKPVTAPLRVVRKPQARPVKYFQWLIYEVDGRKAGTVLFRMVGLTLVLMKYILARKPCTVLQGDQSGTHVQ